MFDALTDPAEAHWRTVSALTAAPPHPHAARLDRLRRMIGALLIRAGGTLLDEGGSACTRI